jgi:hypothetical protein
MVTVDAGPDGAAGSAVEHADTATATRTTESVRGRWFFIIKTSQFGLRVARGMQTSYGRTAAIAMREAVLRRDVSMGLGRSLVAS